MMNRAVSNEWARYQESIRSANWCNTIPNANQKNADREFTPSYANASVSGSSVVSQPSSYEQSRFRKQKTLRHGPVIIPLERIGSPLMDPRLEVANYGEKNTTDLIFIKPEQWNIKIEKDTTGYIRKDETEKVFTIPDYGVYSYRDPLGLQLDIERISKSSTNLPCAPSIENSNATSQWLGSLWGKSADGRGVAQLISAAKNAKKLDLNQLDAKRQKTFYNLTTQKERLTNKNAISIGRPVTHRANLKSESSRAAKSQTETNNIPEHAKTQFSLADKERAETTAERTKLHRPVQNDRKKSKASKTINTTEITENWCETSDWFSALGDKDMERKIRKATDEYKMEMRRRIGSEWERMFSHDGKDGVGDDQRKEKCRETGVKQFAAELLGTGKRRMGDSCSAPAPHSLVETSSRKRKHSMLEADCCQVKYYKSELNGCKLRLIRTS